MMTIRTLATVAMLMTAPAAWAETCKVEVGGDDAMKFNVSEVKVGATCTEVSLTLKHTGKLPAAVMGHNWVLTKTADMKEVATAGGQAKDNNYVPKDDKRVLAATKVIGGGETTSITFPTSGLEKGGDYTYFCSFPGHWAIMKGKFVFGG